MPVATINEKEVIHILERKEYMKKFGGKGGGK